MGLFLNAQETIFRYGEYIEEFHDAFKSNDIFFGSPDDFLLLCAELKVNVLLRTELANLTKSLLEKENNKISVRTVLTVIAISSGGPEITTSERDFSKPINTLIGFLTNAVGCRQIDPEQLDNMCMSGSVLSSVSDPNPVSVDPAPQSIPASETPLNEPPTELPNIPAEPSVSLESDDIEAPSTPNASEDFKQWQARLELNSLEVKLHLDSIDQRISRMEPRLESVPPIPPSAERFQRAARLQTHESHPRPAATALAEPEPEPGDLILHNSEPRGVPLQSYDDPAPFFHSGARVIVILVLLGLAIFAGLFLYRHRSDQYVAQYVARSYQYLQQRLSELRQPHTTASVTPAPVNTPLANTNANSEPAVSSPDATPPSSPTQAPNNQAANPPTQIQPQPPAAESAPLPAATVAITSSAMTANIISAPKPVYPKLAQQNHTQGRVELQATVSSDGNIENLHGIRGPRLLQDAAVDAVSNWRYKPYLVDGRPMPVAILVTIDFTLQPSPNNQQSKLTPSK